MQGRLGPTTRLAGRLSFRACQRTLPNMSARRALGDFGERVAAAHLEVVSFPTVETVGFSNREAAGFNPQSCTRKENAP